MYIEKADIHPKKKIIIFSGAGISAESGISTFRDSNGLWENHKIEDVCNFNTWEKNYNLVHDFYNKRRAQLKDVEPNIAHKTVREIYEKYPEDTFIMTQNVDNLFERAGIPADKICHLHGELTKMKCLNCKKTYDIGNKEYYIGDKCPHCGYDKIKPNIVFFHEDAPMYFSLKRALEYLSNPDSILLIVGTMGNVVDIDFQTSHYKCHKILNNLEPSDMIKDKNYNLVFYEPATKALPKIKAHIEGIF